MASKASKKPAKNDSKKKEIKKKESPKKALVKAKPSTALKATATAKKKPVKKEVAKKVIKAPAKPKALVAKVAAKAAAKAEINKSSKKKAVEKKKVTLEQTKSSKKKAQEKQKITKDAHSTKKEKDTKLDKKAKEVVNLKGPKGAEKITKEVKKGGKEKNANDDEVELISLPKTNNLKAAKEAIIDEMVSLTEDFDLRDIFRSVRDLAFFKGTDNDECVERNCDNLSTTDGYCRYHYIKNWKAIQKRDLILEEGKLQNLIESIIEKYPFKHIESILNDLSDDKEFFKVLKDLNIEAGFEEEGDTEDEDDDIVDETKSYVPVAIGVDEDDL